MKKLFILASALLSGCAAVKQPDANVEVKTIVLPIDAPVLAAAPGQEIYMSKCVACHSSRYVSMQPDFPRKVWEAEVNKMVKVFGAGVSPDQVPEIVDYLTAIKGTPEKKAAQ